MASGAQVVWPQEGELGSRAEWRLLYVVRENKKARLFQRVQITHSRFFRLAHT